jgi:hypothetical protein
LKTTPFENKTAGSKRGTRIEEVPMSGATIVVIAVVVIVLLAVIGGIALTARRRSLQRQFGPEYERVVAEQNSRIRAEAELTGRQRRVRKLDIRPLSDAARQEYSARWLAIQEQFVDTPHHAVAEAYELVTTVMTERGYPIEDDDQMQADLSVEYADTVSQFRSAREITSAAAAGKAQTEDLRQAFIHYRALFSDLLGEPDQVPADDAGAPADDAAPTGPAYPADPASLPGTVSPAGTVSPEGTEPLAGTRDDVPTYEQQRR